MSHADEEDMRDDFEVEIIDLPLDMPDEVTSNDDHFKQVSTTGRPAGAVRARRAITGEDENFEIQITDLPDDGTHRLFSLLSDLWQRLVDRLPEIRVTMQPQEESDNDEGEFSLTVRDLPPEVEAEEKARGAASTKGVPAQPKKSLWRNKRVLIRPLFALSAVLLVVVVVIPASVPFLQRNVLNHLFPAPQAVQPTPTSTNPVHSYFYVCDLGSGAGSGDVQWVRGGPNANCPQGSDSTGSVNGSHNVITIPTASGPSIGTVPTNCLPGSDVTDAHTIGGRPVWVSGFDGPQATIHLGDTPETLISGRWGWSIVTTIWMHFDQNIKVTFSSGNQTGSGVAPLFKFDLEDPLTQSLSFRSHHPSIPDYAGNLTNNWFMTVYFPAAGCYVLNASWPNNGGWHLNFAVGR